VRLKLVDGIAGDDAASSPRGLNVETGRTVTAPDDIALEIVRRQGKHAPVFFERPTPRHDLIQREHRPAESDWNRTWVKRKVDGLCRGPARNTLSTPFQKCGDVLATETQSHGEEHASHTALDGGRAAARQACTR